MMAACTLRLTELGTAGCSSTIGVYVMQRASFPKADRIAPGHFALDREGVHHKIERWQALGRKTI
jgi:hypothetical protein